MAKRNRETRQIKPSKKDIDLWGGVDFPKGGIKVFLTALRYVLFENGVWVLKKVEVYANTFFMIYLKN